MRLPDDDRIESLLQRLDHPAPAVAVDAIIRRARQRRMWAWRPAAAIALLAGMAAVVYAAPNSPVRAWLHGLVTRKPAAQIPQRSEPAPPAVAGIAVDPGASLRIVFRSARAGGVVRVHLTDSGEVLVQAPAGAASFTSDEGRLLIDNAGTAAEFELQIPRSAPRIEVRVGERLLLRKVGPQVTVTKHRLDGSTGACIATEDAVNSERLTRMAGVAVVLSLTGCHQEPPTGAGPAASFKQQLDLAVCGSSGGGFTPGSNNPWFPIQVGKVWRYTGEDDGEPAELTITVLNETETVGGVVTLVVEEREEIGGELVEVSRNFFAQASDGTVCYFGEAVDIYQEDGSITHEGAWRADQPGNGPGVAMPASPVPGMKFQMEDAPGIAEDEATVVGTGPVTVPAGSFTRTIRLRESNPLDGDKGYKWFAHGVGLIIDGSVKLVEYH